jgi:putative drug exporter of the RND superfamily
VPGLSSWAVRRPIAAILAWLFAVAVIIGLTAGFRGTLNDSFELPNTESKVATDLLFGDEEGGGFDATATIVWRPATGSAIDPSVMAVLSPMLERLSKVDGIACVTNPAGVSLGVDCPPPAAPEAPRPEPISEELQRAIAVDAAMNSPVSPDGTTAFSTVTFVGASEEVSAPTAKAILNEVKAANSAAITVGVQGQALEWAGQEPPKSELIGILVAIAILLAAFGSVVAAGLPIVVALLGLAIGQALILISANFLDVATFAPTLAAMIGLGVGIDYALFVLNRFRQAILVGHSPKQAAQEAVETAGRAVLFAGGTVIIALLGLFVLGIGFFNGLAIAASVTVLMVMLSALWLMPALLSLLGNKTLGIRLPWGKRAGSGEPAGRAWAHYGRILQRRPIVPALLAIALVFALASPAFSLRQGFADDSGKPVGSPARIAYDLKTEAFGAGANGPFLVVAQLPKAGDLESFAEIVRRLSATQGVIATSPHVDTLPLVYEDPAKYGVDGDVVSIAVIPTSAPQDIETTQLLERLRGEVNPEIEAVTGAKIYVGGEQAITSDFTTVLSDALPLFLGVVVGLGFLALVLLFRSIIVPLTAALTSLMSFAAAMGITVAVFQWGWFNELLRVPGTGPIFPFLPIMVFAILFGLAMDYQVFLVSRMQEEWARTGDNLASVRRGLAGSGRVVMIAAAIMSSVFIAFAFDSNASIKLFGVALSSAVLIDAFIVRLILVPSIMSMLGKANWWLPGWLDRILPAIKIEPGEDEIVDDLDETSSGPAGVTLQR